MSLSADLHQLFTYDKTIRRCARLGKSTSMHQGLTSPIHVNLIHQKIRTLNSWLLQKGDQAQIGQMPLPRKPTEHADT